jgi:hypothetical protein
VKQQPLLDDCDTFANPAEIKPNPVSQPQHPAEKTVLLLCLRPRTDRSHLTKIRELLQNPLDWEYLYNFAEYHGLAPFFYIN